MVELHRNGALVGTYGTDEDGRYALTGLAPGAYRLTYTDAGRYLPTTPSTVDITVDAGGQAIAPGRTSPGSTRATRR